MLNFDDGMMLEFTLGVNRIATALPPHCHRKTALYVLRRGTTNPSKNLSVAWRIQDQTPERAEDSI